MKKSFFILPIFLSLWITSCTSSSRIIDEKAYVDLINKNEFTFVAKRANPLDYSAINNVASSIPGAIPTRILELDYGYSLILKKDSLSVHLPYFGRAYNIAYGSTNTGFSFESNQIYLKKTQGKKNNTLYYISIRDKPQIQQLILEISPNGKAMLSIDSNDRQPISYDGYITSNEEEKKDKEKK